MPHLNELLTLESVPPRKKKKTTDDASTSGQGAQPGTSGGASAQKSPRARRSQKAVTSPRKKGKGASPKGKKKVTPMEEGEDDDTVEVPLPVPGEGPELLDEAIISGKHIQGKKPADVPDYMSKPLPHESQLFLGCSSSGKYIQLVEYLHANGGYTPIQVQRRGACMFAAFRRNIDCPKEYTNTHLRRQFVMGVLDDLEFFEIILRGHIAGNYGHVRLSAAEFKRKTDDGTITQQEREEYNEPGPFSFHTYLEYMLDRHSWGDEIVLVILSMLFQLRITVVNTNTLLSTQIRHSSPLHEADVVLLLAGGNHYMAAGE